MRHVDHQERANAVGDRLEGGEVDDARIGRAAGDDDLRLVLLGELLDLIEVDAAVLAAHAILHGIEPFAGHVGRRAMGEMAAGGEAHAEDGVAGLGEAEENGLVGLAAGVRLDVGEAAIEELLRPLNREVLGDVDELAAAIVAAAGIALGIFVGEDRALRFKHGGRNDVLRGDQLDFVVLPVAVRCRWRPRCRGRARRVAAKRTTEMRLRPWRLPSHSSVNPSKTEISGGPAPEAQRLSTWADSGQGDAKERVAAGYCIAVGPTPSRP